MRAAGRQPPHRELGADARIWLRWIRSWDTLFYATLLLGSVVAVGLNGAADGRFIMVRTPDESLPRKVNIVLNWFEVLKERMNGR